MIENQSVIHLLQEHWGGFKPQKCDYCDHRTFLKQQMNIHLPIHTGEGRHRCPVEGCNYSTSNHKMWKVHRAKHEGVTFYQCDMCHKGYYVSYSSLQIDMYCIWYSIFLILL